MWDLIRKLQVRHKLGLIGLLALVGMLVLSAFSLHSLNLKRAVESRYRR
jgi:hypothetical protein